MSLTDLCLLPQCKSSNILINKKGVCKVGDFGLARVKSTTRSVLRSTVGTCQYQSPELWHPKPRYDYKVDVYSCSMVFWEMLSGWSSDRVSPRVVTSSPTGELNMPFSLVETLPLGGKERALDLRKCRSQGCASTDVHHQKDMGYGHCGTARANVAGRPKRAPDDDDCRRGSTGDPRRGEAWAISLNVA